MKKIFKDIEVYRKCPEIRQYVRQVYLIKLASIMTFVLFLPFVLFGLIMIGIVHVADTIGQIALWPTHKVTEWLYEQQQSSVHSAHSIVPVSEIQDRLNGNKDLESGDEALES